MQYSLQMHQGSWIRRISAQCTINGTSLPINHAELDCAITPETPILTPLKVLWGCFTMAGASMGTLLSPLQQQQQTFAMNSTDRNVETDIFTPPQ